MRNTFNKFNITDQFYENTEKKDLNPFIDIEYRNDNKSLNSKNIIHTVKNVDNKTNTKFLPRLELFSKHPQTTKKNNFFVTSFRDKYTSDNYKLKSIQISTYDINPNIHNNISNNSNEINDNKILNDTENKYNKELISRSLGSINIIKSIDLINSVNFGNNFLDINKSNSDNLHLNLNLKENEKSQNNGINKKQNQYEEKKNNDKKRMNKNHYILNPDYNCTYNFPFKKISIDDEIKRNINKFNSFVQRKFNLKKYSNLSMTPRRLSNNNNKSKDQEKKSNNSNDNVISISDNIEESIHTHFSNHGNKIQSESNKPNSNKSTNQYINSKKSEKSKETGFIFETNNKISLALDNIVGKVIKGKLFSWVVGDILYESANSTIYKAFNINDGNIFVVKKYNCENGTKCENYFNEVKIYENLNHPNIIKYIFSEQISSYYFLYLEYIPGGSIKNMIEQFGGFNEILIKKYTKQILSGLKYLHDKKIIHRDIKCANILIGNRGMIKLTDFGCSKKISMKLAKKDSSSNGEYCTSLKGTIPWCAPEVICHKKYGKKADIWSLGCTLIEMTGNQPWGNIENIFQVMNKIGKSNLTPEIPDYLSDNFKNFLKLCFKRDPKQRANLKTLIKHSFITGFYL
jgi:hypothetical protein